MTDRQKLDTLWNAVLEDIPEEQLNTRVTSSDINEQSAARLSGNSGQKRMKFRLHGRGVTGHNVASKTAAMTLVAFQEVVTAVGAALSDRATSAGQVAADIVSATELRLTPSTTPGSLILTLVPAHGAPEPTLFDDEPDSLLEMSVTKTFSLLRDVASDKASDDQLVADVRALGTRARRHLLDLSSVLLNDHVELDLDWGTPDGDRQIVGITSRTASHLKRLADEKETTETIRTMTGWLVTVSSEIPQALRTDKGERVNLHADDDLKATLADYYNQRVVISVTTETSINLSSGVESNRHHLRSIELESDRSK